MKLHKITLYTSPSCPRCPTVKKLLEEFCELDKDYELEVVESSTISREHYLKQICSVPSALLDDKLLFNSTYAPQNLDELKVDILLTEAQRYGETW